MKVKNNFVKIQNGNKTYIRKNMILNTYITRLFNAQLDTTHSTSQIASCFIKFDTPIENVQYDTVLTQSDFDVTLFDSTTNEVVGNEKFQKMTERNKNNIKINYLFSNEGLFYAGDEYLYSNDFARFDRKKITAIGFGFGNAVFAFLDTSNMNIIINGNEGINITREDILQSDGICKGFEYPLHLVNDIADYDAVYIEHTTLIKKAQLYSVGFGNTLGLMEEEYLIGNVQVARDDNSITFNVNRVKKVGHYPSENLHLGFYPTMDNSKYLIFKYRLYRYSTAAQGLYEYTDEYYTMSMPNENFGDLEIKLKLERL